MGYENAINKKLALLLWAKDDAGEDDVAVYSGTLIQSGLLYYLDREGDGTNPEIRQEWLPKIEAVPESLKETLLGCDYQLSLSVGDAEEYKGELENFGLKWPG